MAEMTEEEKQAICKKLCGEAAERNMHRLFCPYTIDQWKRGEKHNDPRKGLKLERDTKAPT